VKVVIAGGGSVGTSIALDLMDRHHEVTLMEQNAVTAERLKSMLPGVTVMAADACEYASLASADVRAAEVMIAATGDDEDNLVISLLSKQEFAVPRVIARVNHPKNHWLFNEAWGSAGSRSKSSASRASLVASTTPATSGSSTRVGVWTSRCPLRHSSRHWSMRRSRSAPSSN
jgi:ketopantoate reductase